MTSARFESAESAALGLGGAVAAATAARDAARLSPDRVETDDTTAVTATLATLGSR
jgi:hypothetical protein